MKFIRFTVKGRFHFPLDMLRHDACWPIDSIAAARMEHSFDSRNSEGYEIELAHWAANSNWEPTFGRWASFGWHVMKDDNGWWRTGEMPT